MSLQEFQSTLPLRGVTCEAWEFERFGFISIHTPLAGSDFVRAWSAPNKRHFNPHSPCGE